MKKQPINRRELLQGAGVLGLGTAIVGASRLLIPATPKLQVEHADSPVRSLESVSLPGNVNACSLTPAAAAGPFYLDTGLLRRDITDGRPGLPLICEWQVVRASSCAPIQGAVVDVWHCDALGGYSAYGPNSNPNRQDHTGMNFLRGIQVTDSMGMVRFDTIYPGWYPGRAIHVHFTVRLNARHVVTSQSYFPDTLSNVVLKSAEPYRVRTGARTTNSQDGIYNSATLMTLSGDGAGLVARFIIGIA